MYPGRNTASTREREIPAASGFRIWGGCKGDNFKNGWREGRAWTESPRAFRTAELFPGFPHVLSTLRSAFRMLSITLTEAPRREPRSAGTGSGIENGPIFPFGHRPGILSDSIW
jgi:hypothetical protein